MGIRRIYAEFLIFYVDFLLLDDIMHKQREGGYFYKIFAFCLHMKKAFMVSSFKMLNFCIGSERRTREGGANF